MSTQNQLDELKVLVKEHNVQHVAMIMDGNRRWAKSRSLPTLAGHKQGVDTLKAIIRHCGDIDIKYLTVYAFSTENWRRQPEEVDYLMKLFIQALSRELDEMHDNGVRLRFVGDLSGLSHELQDAFNAAMTKTQENTKITLQVAVNYGSRLELVHSVREIAKKVRSGELLPEEINEDAIAENLYTAPSPDPDILVRTGGDYRISNYLLWQCAYTELFITEALWPEFSPDKLNDILKQFVQRQRRFGQ